ncbi:hypothetical protein [Sphingobacterium gobiense]|uniref:Uncharacterized protein n=1 Tax=Sphingobacterium gobiense TaxID=1382456 RepID=A0A2S9JTZ5_9SPHI|nr:hypothetical protein [Sphingobacterium gobiense]PRD56746.1 hypothetical protein C5749_05825 [Sphingobacterium gobiense]
MKNYDNLVLVIAVAILGFFGGIAFVNNWLVLNKHYPEVGMFDVPFKADVWGTVSDWAIVLITILTARYLVKTFIEQKNINKASLLPIFKIKQQPVWDSKRGCSIMRILLVKNTAYYIAPSRSYGKFLLDPAGFPLIMYLAESESFEIECSGILPSGTVPTIVTLMRFSFKDVSGNTYFQEITYHRWRQEYSLSVPQAKIE